MQKVLKVFKPRTPKTVRPFKILGKAKQKDELDTILKDPQQRNLFFQQGQSQFNKYLQKFGAAKVLAAYLTQYGSEPWLNEGLTMFSSFARKKGQENLFIEALAHLKEVSEKESYDKLMQHLISSEEALNAILLSFGSHEQEAKNRLNMLAKLFTNTHLMPLIKKLNEQDVLPQGTQHNLLIAIFRNTNKNLFVDMLEPSELVESASNEILEWSWFLLRFGNESRKKNQFDHQYIAEEMLMEIVLKAARKADTSLFFDLNNQFNDQLAGYALPNKLLNKRITSLSPTSHVAQVVNDKLKEGLMMREWSDLIEHSWEGLDTDHFPLICTYLMNFTGDKTILTDLVNTYFLTAKLKSQPNNPLHHISQMIALLPNRDVSMVLFDLLEQSLDEHPEYLDKKLLTHLAQFNSKRHYGKLMETEIILIKHFGCQKRYALVQRCCEILLTDLKEDKEYKDKEDEKLNLFAQVSEEANIEKSLAKYEGRWFFTLLCYVKHWWHYGFDPVENTTGLVKFTNDLQPYENPNKAPPIIKSCTLGDPTHIVIIDQMDKMTRIKNTWESFVSKYPQKNATTRPTLVIGNSKPSAGQGLFTRTASDRTEEITEMEYYSDSDSDSSYEAVNLS